MAESDPKEGNGPLTRGAGEFNEFSVFTKTSWGKTLSMPVSLDHSVGAYGQDERIGLHHVPKMLEVVL